MHEDIAGRKQVPAASSPQSLHGDADMFLMPCFPDNMACSLMKFTLGSCPSSSRGDMSWVT